MSAALALLLQLVVGGAASAAATVFWVWRAAKWGTQWDFALIVLLGLAVGLAVWLAGRAATRTTPDGAPQVRVRPFAPLAMAVLGMLMTHADVMRSLQSGTVVIPSLPQDWPGLASSAFLPLAGALLGYWLGRLVSLVTALQVGAAIGLSSIAGFGFVFLANQGGGPWRLDFILGMLVTWLLPAAILLGVVVWLIGAAGALFRRRPQPGIKPLLLAILLAFVGMVLVCLAYMVVDSLGTGPGGALVGFVGGLVRYAIVFLLPAGILLGLLIWLIAATGAWLWRGLPRPGIKPLVLAIMPAFAGMVLVFLAVPVLGPLAALGSIERWMLGFSPFIVPAVGAVIGYWLFTRFPARANE